MKHILCIFFIFVLQSAIVAGNNDKIKAPVKSVSGKITTVSGEEIAGVKITIKETNQTFFADLDGNFKFELRADKPCSITLESMGYAPLEIKSTELNLFSGINLKEL